ncbi:hypothetical protein [Bacillus toyonensis]|uniref:hypothetical protein n=1 Tax=Bacillus toyonensis TaxID=155322 RepID=UPI00211D74D3
MDKKLEEIIVKSFFTKRLQHRVLFELSSSKNVKMRSVDFAIITELRYVKNI